MAKFYILHLSDLHIENTITTPLSNLISSIGKNDSLRKYPLIIAVTGDIVNRGNYREYSTKAFSFFQKLKKKLEKSGIKVADFHIVPGNHDKVTTDSNRLFSIAQHSGVEFPNAPKDGMHHIPLEKDVTALQLEGFNDYLQLCNSIFKEFGINKSYTSTYGVDKTTIDNTDIAFVRLNTAISCYGSPNDGEKYHLKIGDTQLNEIKKQYVDIKTAANDAGNNLLTLCIAHHPTSYLAPEESAKVNQMLISEDELNVDYFLSGHVHDGALNNLSNHNRSMLSLETGIGWPDTLATTHKNHRYSIYCFDEEKTTFYSEMYKTNQANQFEPDSDYFITDQERQTKRIYSPLKTRDYAFIPLNDNAESKQTYGSYVFVDGNSILDLRSLFSTIRDFSIFCTKLIPNYQIQTIEEILSTENEAGAGKKEIKDIISKYINLTNSSKYSVGELEKSFKAINRFFQQIELSTIARTLISYLMHVSQQFVENFQKYFGDSECRAVFRIYSAKTKKCIPIGYCPEQNNPRIESTQNRSGKPRAFDYDRSLIKSAYTKHCSMIYSINKESNYFSIENWDDFFVVTPAACCYQPSGQSSKIPLFSFVFSVRLKQEFEKVDDGESRINRRKKLVSQTQKLFLLQFSHVEDIITDVINSFYKSFPFNPEEMIAYFDNNELL